MTRPLTLLLPLALLLAPAARADTPPASLILRFTEGPCTAERLDGLSRRSGVALRQVRPMGGDSCVVRPLTPLSPEALRQLPRRLLDAGGLQLAEPNVHGQIMSTNRLTRPLARTLPQWYLDDPAVGIDAERAWRITPGSPAITVAVLDSGVLFTHPELRGRLLPGQDLVSRDDLDAEACRMLPAELGCPFIRAVDGDDRDPDASDPGNWNPDALYRLAGAKPPPGGDFSNWHGTLIAGVIAARGTDGGKGLRGIDRRAKILPVRTVGRSFELADIVDSIRWAAGLPVPGTALNRHPAQVLNLSMGLPREDAEQCPQVLQEAIDAALAAGSTRAIVATAGNDGARGWLNAPGSCRGVISVGAVERSGELAGYSNRAPALTLVAPASSRLGTENDFPVLSNCGLPRPAQTADTCPDPAAPGAPHVYRAGHGTSVAAPMVSATVSLMLAANPSLSPAAIRQILVRTARPFPRGTSCAQAGAQCGAGLLNTGSAVALAARQAGGLHAPGRETAHTP